MGDPYVQATWGHYYHIGGGAFIHSHQYPPPPSFLPVGLQPTFYNYLPQGSYGYYQPGWNVARPGPTEAAKNSQAAATAKEGCSEQEFHALENHDPTPMDISPQASPAKQPSKPMSGSGTAGSFQPKKPRSPQSTCNCAENDLHHSSSERATLHAVQTTSTVKIQCSGPSQTASVLSVEKCKGCMRSMMVQAKVTSSCVKVELCTCVQTAQESGNIEHQSPKASMQATAMSRCCSEVAHCTKNAKANHGTISAVSADSRAAGFVSSPSRHSVPRSVVFVPKSSQRMEPRFSGSAASWSQHVEPIKNPSFDQDMPKGDSVTNVASGKPRRRVIVRHLNGVARLFAVSPRSPFQPEPVYTLIGKGTVDPHHSSISRSMKEVRGDQVATREFDTEEPIPKKSSTQKSESLSSTKDLKQPASRISHSKETVKSPSEPAVECLLDELKHLRGRSGRRRRQKLRQKLQKRGDSLPASTSEVCTGGSLTGAIRMQEKPNSIYLADRHEDLLCSVLPVSAGQASKESSVSGCVQADKAVPRSTLSSPVSLKSLCVNDADSTQPSHRRQPCTSDVLCSEKLVTSGAVNVLGLYEAGQAINIDTSFIDINVDTNLGGCEEHGDGPFELLSQLEKLDEGWMWSFDSKS